MVSGQLSVFCPESEGNKSEGSISEKVLFIAPDFSLGIPRLKPRVINASPQIS